MGKLGLNSGYIGSDQRTTTNGVVGYDKYYLERANGRFNPVLPFSGLLNSYPGAAIAYSLRRLNSNYNGSIIRVRRSLDNTEQDIGFDGNGNLNTTALLSFCGAGDGFVTTWYDQSDNTNNATQTTAANQPQIVISGGLILKNSKPIVFFVDDFLSLSTSITPSSNWSIFGVGQPTLTNKTMAYLGGDLNPNTSLIKWADNNIYLLSSANYVSTSDIPSLNYRINSGFIISNVASFIYSNGSLLSTSSVVSSQTSIFKYIGKYSSELTNAYISEIILYQSNQTINRADIESNINFYYSVY
jgi:hypothetical protein